MDATVVNTSSGLGYGYGDDGVVPTFLNAVGQGLLKPVFGMWTGSVEGKDGAEVSFGQLDSTRYSGSLSCSPLVSTDYYQIEMTGVGPTKCHRERCTAIIDSGTSLVYGPKKNIHAINRMIGELESLISPSLDALVCLIAISIVLYDLNFYLCIIIQLQLQLNCYTDCEISPN